MTDKGFHRFTEKTVADRDALARELADIRARGYAVDNMEHEYGIKCVSVPIVDKLGRVAGGISISGPSLRFEDERIHDYAAKLQ